MNNETGRMPTAYPVDRFWSRQCPRCGSRDLRVVACRVLDIDNGEDAGIGPDGFSFRHLGYDTNDVSILCGDCRETLGWDDCPRIISEPREPTPEDLAEQALTSAMFNGELP
jgi:hypothetical protein